MGGCPPHLPERIKPSFGRFFCIPLHAIGFAGARFPLAARLPPFFRKVFIIVLKGGNCAFSLQCLTRLQSAPAWALRKKKAPLFFFLSAPTRYPMPPEFCRKIFTTQSVILYFLCLRRAALGPFACRVPRTLARSLAPKCKNTHPTQIRKVYPPFKISNPANKKSC